jgi:biopolymer transport protein ExbD
MRIIWLGLLVFGCVVACDSKPAPNPFEDKAAASVPPPIQAPPKPPEGPPEFTVLAEGPKVGWTYLMLDKPEGKQKLTDEVGKAKQYVAGKDVPLRADRQAKLAYVAAMMRALEAAGATSVTVTTETRTEFPKSVKFSPQGAGKSAPSCSIVAKVLSERRNAVWTLAGGMAIKSPKGLAGPDMAMTEDRLTSTAQHCKASDFVFVSADDDVEWGLVYDLAAATQSLEKAKFDKVVLLEPAPTAGRPVKLESAD